MTFRTRSRLTISRSVPEVWGYICDVERWPEWAPTVDRGWVAGGGPLTSGARIEQRAKLMFGLTRHRAQTVTAVEAPHRVAFAGPFGTAAARWGMELESIDAGRTETEMWVEVDLRNIMRAIPAGPLRSRIQRVMDIEMDLIKAAIESAPVREPVS